MLTDSSLDKLSLLNISYSHDCLVLCTAQIHKVNTARLWSLVLNSSCLLVTGGHSCVFGHQMMFSFEFLYEWCRSFYTLILSANILEALGNLSTGKTKPQQIFPILNSPMIVQGFPPPALPWRKDAEEAARPIVYESVFNL